MTKICAVSHNVSKIVAAVELFGVLGHLLMFFNLLEGFWHGTQKFKRAFGFLNIILIIYFMRNVIFINFSTTNFINFYYYLIKLL